MVITRHLLTVRISEVVLGLALIQIYGSAISPQYKADPADRLTELLPLIWIYEYMDRQSVCSTRLTLRTVSLTDWVITIGMKWIHGSSISMQYKACPADSLTELLPLVWIHGSAISLQYKACPADSLTELLPLVWIHGSAISPQCKANLVDGSYVIQMEPIH